MNIILAIHPEHAENILHGIKTAELRKVLPKQLSKGDTIYLLATGTRHIVGHCTFAGASLMPAAPLHTNWLESVATAAAVSTDFAAAYFKGARTAAAWFVRYPVRYAKPMPYTGPVVQSYTYTETRPQTDDPRVENYRLYCKTHP